MNRSDDLRTFYAHLDRLRDGLGGYSHLSVRDSWRRLPARGVYFFFEEGEERSGSGAGPRTVRVGTHALKLGGQSSLSQRLRAHCGQTNGGGSHRTSIFRLLVGQALQARGVVETCPSWGLGGTSGAAAEKLELKSEALRDAERGIEEAASRAIGAMPFLWINIPDEPGPSSARGWIERNAIALLSNRRGDDVDPPSAGWLGHSSNRPLVRDSGLWNQNHVDEDYDRSFLTDLNRFVEETIACR